MNFILSFTVLTFVDLKDRTRSSSQADCGSYPTMTLPTLKQRSFRVCKAMKTNFTRHTLTQLLPITATCSINVGTYDTHSITVGTYHLK